MADDRLPPAAAAVAVPDPDDDSDEGGANVEKRLGKLERSLTETLKALDEEKKSSAGKDKKITELANEKKELQKATLSKDQLLELRQRELDEKESAWEAKMAAETIELRKLRTEQLRTKVISKFDNFPSFLIDRIRGETEEEIEADIRGLQNKWVKERDKVDNARKLGTRPKSGSGRQLGATADEVDRMSPEEKKRWASTASDEELQAVLEEM
jgi:hypothetical protein